jgi:hypothetical protein
MPGSVVTIYVVGKPRCGLWRSLLGIGIRMSDVGKSGDADLRWLVVGWFGIALRTRPRKENVRYA